MNVMFFLIYWLLTTILILTIAISTLLNSYWLKNVIHVSFSIEIDVFLLTFFWQIRPHIFSIEKNRQSSSLNNSHKLPLPLPDNLYQYNGSSKLSIDVINYEANTLWALVKEYLSSTTGSELLLLNKFVRMTGGHFVTVISLDDDELIMTKYSLVTNTHYI